MRKNWLKGLTAFLLTVVLMVPGSAVWAAELFEDGGAEILTEDLESEAFPEGFQADDSLAEEIAGAEAGDFSEEMPENKDAGDTWISVGYENPLYGGRGEIYYGETTAPVQAYGRTAAPYFDSEEAAEAYMRKCMKERENNVSLRIRLNGKDIKNLAVGIFHGAYGDNGKFLPDEGDYLRFQYGYMNCVMKRDEKDENLVTYSYKLLYYTTKEQEDFVSSEVQRIRRELQLNGLGEAEKIRKIYDYVCRKVRYDYKDYGASIPGKEVLDGKYTYEEYLVNKGRYTAYNALSKGEAVCQGYANLLYRLLREEGISNRIIAGKGGTVAHAWNIIRQGNYYYNSDSTWDAGKAQYQYFMKNKEDFTGHVRNEEYETEEFLDTYPVPEPFPAEKVTLKQTIYTYTGKAVAPVLSMEGFTYGRHYEAVCEDNILPGIMKIKVKGLGRFVGEGELTAKIVKLPKIAAVTGLQQRTQSTDQITFVWNPVPGANKYQVYLYSTSGKKFYCKETVNAPVYTLKGAGVYPGKEYQIKVRAYFRDTYEYGGMSSTLTSIGGFSNVLSGVTRPQVPILRAVTSKNGRISALWGRFSACNGYQLQFSTNSKFTSGTTQTVTMPKNIYYTKTINKLNNQVLRKNGRYYVRIRAYKTSPTTRKNYYGNWSSGKSVVCR